LSEVNASWNDHVNHEDFYHKIISPLIELSALV